MDFHSLYKRLATGFIGGIFFIMAAVPAAMSGSNSGITGSNSGMTETTAGISESFEEPKALLLTWQYDPATTMTIDWHVVPENEGERVLYYKPVGDEEWNEAESFRHFFPYSNRIIHRTQLTGLDPDSEYRFRVSHFEREYKFRTMPAELDRPVRFATGGDTDHSPDGRTYEMNQVVMEYDLDFIAWGGDLAYNDGGDPDRGIRWYGWFEANYNTLVSEDGRVVPIVVGIGNHEVKRYIGGNQWYNFDGTIRSFEPTAEWRQDVAPFFYNLFAFPGQPGYGVLDFGDYMSLFILDSGHTNTTDGPQRDWLESELRERHRQNISHIFPVYHVPAYPSHRSFGGTSRTNVRENWVPLFEEYGVRVAFENHDHTYKRTHPIRDGEIAGDGIVYIGDGAWGRSPREGSSRDEWYINEFASQQHAIIVTLEGETQEYIMITPEGEILDSYTDSR